MPPKFSFKIKFKFKFKEYSVIPGFPLSFSYSLIYLALFVILPLFVLIVKGSELGLSGLLREIFDLRTLLSFKLSLLTALVAALTNACFGTIVAWFLVRTPFPGKKIFDALIDLPLALPTAVSGIVLTVIYAPSGVIGNFFLKHFQIKIAFTPLGIIVAMIFVGIPLVVRTVGPVLMSMESELEEVALSLGANKWQVFIKVILPTIFPSIITGFTLAFARALGEFGTIIFIAGNMPMKTEITALLVYTKLEQHDVASATAIALGMLLLSFLLLLLINLFQSWTSKKVTGV
ncbi:MAG: sulfate ABC transporter permease subunit CysT [Oligoflexia bacterium]|nr:sulfate ABC transporter permease subunit CysT [Oligoflexia bacterium]MBF0365843.1 sulfate ABC transporter permease subunit CysT [Oligoflexia bacterium]